MQEIKDNQHFIVTILINFIKLIKNLFLLLF